LKIFCLLIISIFFVSCSSKIERTISLTPVKDYEQIKKNKILVVRNTTGIEGIMTDGNNPKIEISYLVPNLTLAVKNKLTNCLINIDNINSVDIIESQFIYRNMITKGSTRFLLKLQTKYKKTDGKIDYVIYQNGSLEKDIVIGFKGVDVSSKINKYFAKSLDKICNDMNDDISKLF